MSEPVRFRNAPADVVSLHAQLGPWRRETPWAFGNKRGTYEATYASTERSDRRRVAVERTMIGRAEVVRWTIENGGRAFFRNTRAKQNRAEEKNP